MLELQLQDDSKLTDYKLSTILVDSLKYYYGIIDGLTVEPIWIPKSAVNEDLRVKEWLVRQFKEGETTLKRMGKKLTQTSLATFVCQ